MSPYTPSPQKKHSTLQNIHDKPTTTNTHGLSNDDRPSRTYHAIATGGWFSQTYSWTFDERMEMRQEVRRNKGRFWRRERGTRYTKLFCWSSPNFYVSIVVGWKITDSISGLAGKGIMTECPYSPVDLFKEKKARWLGSSRLYTPTRVPEAKMLPH